MIPAGNGTWIQVCDVGIFRVIHTPEHSTMAPERESLIAKTDWPPVDFSISKLPEGETVITTAQLVITAEASGRVRCQRLSDGKIILEESGSVLIPTTDLGEPSYVIEQSWKADPRDALYGGGSFQNGLSNLQFAPIEMIQFNTEAIVPFFVSTSGFGLLWDSYAWTHLNPSNNRIQLTPSGNVPGKQSLPAIVRRTALANILEPSRVTVDPSSICDVSKHNLENSVFTGQFQSAGPGFYHFQVKTNATYGIFSFEAILTAQEMSDLGAPVGDPIDIIRWQDLSNCPNSLTGRISMKSGTIYQLSLSISDTSHDAKLYIQYPDYNLMTLRSDQGEIIDYFVVNAPSVDDATSGYRKITGAATLYRRSVFGFWQCKEHYHNQKELIDAAIEFRKRSIPIDNIVQDWQYWGSLGWGPQWDPTTYPDPSGMVAELKSINISLMVSVWCRFDTDTIFFHKMLSKGHIIEGSTYYDPFDADARELFYSFSKAAHFLNGVEALWLDATEPEQMIHLNKKLAIGSGNTFANPYSLLTSQAISDGLQRDFPQSMGARVFSLTRSSFAGQQRTGAALWTGDISGTWDSLRRQVVSSLNYQLSGIPYWSEDIGGFFRPSDQHSLEYLDLMSRWFQFGAFTPIYRVHGCGTDTEIWNYGDEIERRVNGTHNLRYRLLPYTYSAFAEASMKHSTVQRHLVFDFSFDPNVFTIGDQFMWGPNILVSPFVTAADSSASSRNIYIPAGTGEQWIDFWTGTVLSGSGWVSVLTTPDYIPLHVRNCSVVILAPFLQSSADPRFSEFLEVRVYPPTTSNGCDLREFNWYEDDGFSNDHLSGSRSLVTVSISADKLTFSKRDGTYSGIRNTIDVRIVVVRNGRGVGLEVTQNPDLVFSYTGDEISHALPL